jgi:hypothetical protein
MPWNVSPPNALVANQALPVPTVVPTYAPNINSSDPLPTNPPPGTTPSTYPIQGMLPGGSLAWNSADEMNLYTPNHYDAPFGPQDLEWLYRKHDVDGASLSSRLSLLDQGYFTASSGLIPDTMTRRRLFGTDVWERNNFSITNGINNAAFPVLDPANPAPNVNPVYPQGSPNYPFILAEPPLAFGDRRINLNYPLPIDARSDEPVRQKWCTETYRLLKAILPPSAVDTPEELAALSQFVVNIVDFRDPDATMTHFRNPDVKVVPADNTGMKPSYLVYSWVTSKTTMNANNPHQGDTHIDLAMPLDQYGMEYPPVAITEVLAYTFTASKPPTGQTPQQLYRIWIELQNTLTKDNGSGNPGPGTASDLDLNGWQWAVLPDDYTGRPDPFTGFAPYFVNGAAAVNLLTGNPNNLMPIVTGGTMLTNPIPALDEPGTPTYYVMSNKLLVAGAEVATTGPLPTSTPNGVDQLPDLVSASTAVNKYYWLYLLRPSNPFDTSSQPVVVDSFRFPYTKDNGTADGQGNVTKGTLDLYSLHRLQPYRGGQDVPVIGATPPNPAGPYLHDPVYGLSEQTAPPPVGGGRKFHGVFNSAQITNDIAHSLGTAGGPRDSYSAYLPFHDRDFSSVAELLLVPGCPPSLFTKQFLEKLPPNGTTYQGPWSKDPNPKNNNADYPYVTPPPQRPQNWQTDGVTVAVPPNPQLNNPGTPPIYTNPTPNYYEYVPLPFRNGVAYTPANPPTIPNDIPQAPVPPVVFPYLPDAFYYDSYYFQDNVTSPGNPTWQITPNANLAGTNPWRNDQSGTSWYKMLEFFEVPTPSFGSIGPVAMGSNLDWLRQDLRPGQINLNLIIDEEVFYGIIDDPRLNSRSVVPVNPSPAQQLALPRIVTQVDLNGTPTASYPISDLGRYPRGRGWFNINNAPADTSMKGAFSDFLKLQRGGSNFLFGHGVGNLAGPYSETNPNTLVETRVAADRPFHSLSYPKIEYTAMRPAKLDFGASPYNANLPQTWSAKLITPSGTPPPGPPNPWLVLPPGTLPPAGVTSVLPTPPIQSPYNWTALPPRRLFELPDAVTTIVTRTSGQPPQAGPPAQPATGDWAISPYLVYNPAGQTLVDQSPDPANLGTNLTDGRASIVDNTITSTTLGATPDYFLGSTPPPPPTAGPPPTNPPPTDYRQHPYYRTEWLQKVLNLTTVRTHQYAVWVTVGFFEVVKAGNAQLVSTAPAPAAALGNLQAGDELGPELGLATGKNIRYRGFFLLDRTPAIGFNPRNPGDFRACVAYRRRIE